MHNRLLTVRGGSLLLMAAVLSLAVTCAPAAPVPTPTPAKPQATAPTPAKAPAAAPTPAAPAAPAPTKAPVATPQAKGPSAADFFRGKTVELVVMYGAGGNVDFAARAFASQWQQVAGGSMIVRNRAGGGGLDGINFVFDAEPTGLTLGFGLRGPIAANQILKVQGVRYDIGKMSWIGDFSRDPVSFAVGTNQPYTSMDDLRPVSGLVFGTTTPRGAGALGGALVAELFQLKDARVVPGYASSAEVLLAVERGEVQGYAFSTSTVRSGVDKGTNKVPFVTLDFERDATFPNTPTIVELLRPTGQQEQALRILVPIVDQSRVVYGPPGIPEDRLQFVRQSFDKIMESAAFRATLAPQYPVWTGSRKGDDAATEIRKLAALPAEDIATFDQMTSRYIK
ncbi:MAG: hypothetical protein HY675_18690 [Chloroflexi bacterium]|nr:hypothetical protein [Chloroflexota bacterium]